MDARTTSAPSMLLLKYSSTLAFAARCHGANFFSGLGELAKNAALLGGEHAEGFKNALSKDVIDAQNGGSGEEFSLSDDAIHKLVRLGIQAKMGVLRDDAYEKTHGMIFEYGHTMSHALEKTYGDGVVPHGLGVTYGMLACSYAAERQGIMSPAKRSEHDEICHLLIQRWPLPQPLPSVEEVMARAMRDSKRGITSEAEDEISDVLLRDVGDVLPSKTANLNKFPSALFADWLVSMGFPTTTGSADKQKSGYVAVNN